MAKILVVEDFEDSRFSLCRLLEMSGHEVIEAADGAQAVGAATEAHPDLVLMDLTLPVIDGIEATKRIREIEGLGDMPIVAVSADFDELEALIGRMLG
jgi:CheY-like chemotaxis protein